MNYKIKYILRVVLLFLILLFIFTSFAFASTPEAVVLVSDAFYYATDSSNTVSSITSTNANVGMAFATTDTAFNLTSSSTDKYYYFGRNNATLGRQLAYLLKMDNVINPDYTSTAGLTYEFNYFLDTSVYNPFEENKLLLPVIIKGDISEIGSFLRINKTSILDAENIDQNLFEGETVSSLSSSPTCELYEDSISVYKCTAQFYISPENYNTGTGSYYFGFMHKDSSSYNLPKIIFKNFLVLDRTVNEYKMTITPDPTPEPSPTPTPTVEEEQLETSKGIWGTIKSIFESITELPVKIANFIIDGLKSLFIPEDMSFINDFVDSIESKLGFIAEVPLSIIDFLMSLASASWEDITSISFPSVEMFGVSFWNSQEVDITEGIKIFQPFKYMTDCLCVILMSRGLIKTWENFTGGEGK